MTHDGSRDSESLQEVSKLQTVYRNQRIHAGLGAVEVALRGGQVLPRLRRTEK